ncbi:MAG: hypothetical protein QW733_01890 [Desulfurococcaceae archaeon]
MPALLGITFLTKAMPLIMGQAGRQIAMQGTRKLLANKTVKRTALEEVRGRRLRNIANELFYNPKQARAFLEGFLPKLKKNFLKKYGYSEKDLMTNPAVQRKFADYTNKVLYQVAKQMAKGKLPKASPSAIAKDWLSTFRQVSRMWRDKDKAQQDIRNAFKEIIGYQINGVDFSLMTLALMMLQNLRMVGKLAKESVNKAYDTIKNSITLTAEARTQLKALKEVRRARKLGEAFAQNVNVNNNVVPFAPKLPVAPRPPAPNLI